MEGAMKGNAYCPQCGHVIRDTYLITLESRRCPRCGWKGLGRDRRRSADLAKEEKVSEAVRDAIREIRKFCGGDVE